MWGRHSWHKNCWRNTPVVNSIPSTLKFSVTSSVNEPVYTVFNSTDTIIYAGYTYESNDDDAYNNPAMPRVYMITYNDNFRSNPYNSGEWRNGDTGYKYSNQNGELNTNAEGFLYSPGGDGSANGHLYVSNIRVNVNQGWETSSGNNNTLYMSIYGTPYKVGEYRLSYFFEGKYKGIKVVYTHFVNSIRFTPKMSTLLPLTRKKKDEYY